MVMVKLITLYQKIKYHATEQNVKPCVCSLCRAITFLPPLGTVGLGVCCDVESFSYDLTLYSYLVYPT